MENIGRDSETFLRAICENYDLIKENYDHVSFFQANPFDHCPDAANLLPLNNNDIYLHLSYHTFLILEKH